MRPIHYRADVAFHQALRCVEFRLPPAATLRPRGQIFALGLRYGLIGTAACHQLVLSADIAERHDLTAAMLAWPALVEEHVREFVLPKIDARATARLPEAVADLASPAVRDYLPKCRCLHPLDRALASTLDDFLRAHRNAVLEEWPWFKRRRALRDFQSSGQESTRYALNFYERRMADIDEVREIALLDE